VNIQQGTPEWHDLRRGKATASRIPDIIAKTKSGPSTSRANYEAELIAERLTGVTAESYVNGPMRWGIDTEPQAREAYVIETLQMIEEVAFVPHPTIAMSGCSPDGLVGTDGMIEIKCPLTSTHIETLLTKNIASKYIVQMQFQMACTGRAWCDFVSFDPRMPSRLQLFVKRIDRDQAMIDDLEHEVRTFLAEVEHKVAALERIGSVPPKRGWSDLSFPQQAGIRCGDQIFRAFLKNWYGEMINTEEDAANFVRDYCNVKSRADLKEGDGAVLWNVLEDQFEEWKIMDRAGMLDEVTPDAIEASHQARG
jgi:putative phage-type endonuclease